MTSQILVATLAVGQLLWIIAWAMSRREIALLKERLVTQDEALTMVRDMCDIGAMPMKPKIRDPRADPEAGDVLFLDDDISPKYWRINCVRERGIIDLQWAHEITFGCAPKEVTTLKRFRERFKDADVIAPNGGSVPYKPSN